MSLVCFSERLTRDLVNRIPFVFCSTVIWSPPTSFSVREKAMGTRLDRHTVPHLCQQMRFVVKSKLFRTKNKHRLPTQNTNKHSCTHHCRSPQEHPGVNKAFVNTLISWLFLDPSTNPAAKCKQSRAYFKILEDLHPLSLKYTSLGATEAFNSRSSMLSTRENIITTHWLPAVPVE